MQKHYLAAAIVVFIIISAIFAQYALSANRRYDEQAEKDLTSIQESAKDYYHEHKKLAVTMDDLDISQRLKSRSQKRKYEYRELNHFGIFGDEKYFEVCAEFKTDTKKDYHSSYYDQPRYHTIGKNCYTTKVN